MFSLETLRGTGLASVQYKYFNMGKGRDGHDLLRKNIYLQVVYILLPQIIIL